MRVREDYRTLTGPEKAAILMLSIGEEHASRLFLLMDDEEIRQVSQTMSNLGTVHASVIERLFAEFSGQVAPGGLRVETSGSAERLLETVLGTDHDKLAIADETMLSSSLQNEQPQTAALALSKIKPESAARILGQLPEGFATDVVMHMLRQGTGKKIDTDGDLPRTLESGFVSALEERNRASADRIKTVAFGFEDLGRLDPVSVQTLLRHVDRAKLAIALKGASEPLRDLFFANLSQIASKKLRDEVLALGPIKLREVDEAQMHVIALAKELRAKDESALADQRGDDELIY